MKSSTWKWVGVIALAVVGILALIVAIEWLTVPIHQLPAVIGGKHGHGHYKRRGEALLVFSIVVLLVSVYLGFRLWRASGDRGSPGAGGEVAQPEAAPASDPLMAQAPTPTPTPSPSPEPQPDDHVATGDQ